MRISWGKEGTPSHKQSILVRMVRPSESFPHIQMGRVIVVCTKGELLCLDSMGPAKAFGEEGPSYMGWKSTWGHGYFRRYGQL